MKSSTGTYWEKLDHVRAVAALLVFSWHFAMNLKEENFTRTSFLLIQGHFGVSLFMVLSGYLFAQILENTRHVRWSLFWLNRMLRILPLLTVSFLLTYISTSEIHSEPYGVYLRQIINGFFLGNWPNAAWSVALEMQFYFLLPILLILLKNKYALPTLLFCSLAARHIIYENYGFVRPFAYNFLIGRIDQLVLGILIFHHRDLLTRYSKVLIPIMGIGCLCYIGYFNYLGGYQKTYESRIWIFSPLIEGLLFALGILFYEHSSRQLTGYLRRALRNLGKVSFSFYLLHQFILGFIFDDLFHLTKNFPSIVLFLVTVLITYILSLVSYHLIESPLLKLRKPYIFKEK